MGDRLTEVTGRYGVHPDCGPGRMPGMTCEDTTTRITWEIQLYEPASRVWMCQGYGRATTTADPTDIARALLAGHLAGRQVRASETFRAVVRPDTGEPAIVGAGQMEEDGWKSDPAVRQALPLYLRDALPTG